MGEQVHPVQGADSSVIPRDMRDARIQPLPTIEPDSSSSCRIRTTHWVDEGRNGGIALLVGRNRPFVVKIFERAAETWESIREGVNLLDEWMKALERHGIRDSSETR